MTTQKRYVLTGGPGSGKSTLIRALQNEQRYTIDEAAENYIRQRQEQGVKEPWLEENFQESILELQLKREAEIPKNSNETFIDRGILDGQAYLTDKDPTYKRIDELAKENKYDHIFMIEPLSFTKKETFRRESRDEALELTEKLDKIYKDHGYKITYVKSGTVEERLKTINDTLKKLL